MSTTAAAGVPAADHVGLVLNRGGDLDPCTPSDPLIGQIEHLQAGSGHGPCHDALDPQSAAGILVDDIVDETRWPDVAAAIAATGIRSLLAVPLPPAPSSSATAGGRAGPTGVLTYYSCRPHAFDAVSRTACAAAAGQAALVVAGVAAIDGLERALQTRDVIGRAKGILIERYGLDDQQAFDRLVASSKHTNIKLRDVAHWLATQPAQSAQSAQSAQPTDTTQPARTTGRRPRPEMPRPRSR